MSTFLLLLVLGIVSLVLGCLLGIGLRHRGWGLAALKGLTASFIGGLLLFHLMPESYRASGPISLVAMALGFIALILAEKFLPHGHSEPTSGRYFTAELLWMGLLVHQATDGMALALSTRGHQLDWNLALIVVAHQLPVAAIITYIFHIRHSAGGPWLRILAMAMATILGALFQKSLAPFLSAQATQLFLAFIAGSFLHVLTHDYLDHHAHESKDKRWEFLAFFAGIGLLFALEYWMPSPIAATINGEQIHDLHAHGEHMGEGRSFFVVILGLFKETSPYLMLGLICAGLLHGYLPQASIRWLRSGGSFQQSLRGMIFGLPLPVCSCGVIPLFTSLAKRGAPTAGLLAFLVATPELGVDSFLLSLKLLGPEFTMLRVAMAMILPIGIAVIAARFLPSPVPEKVEVAEDCCVEKPKQGKNQGQSQVLDYKQAQEAQSKHAHSCSPDKQGTSEKQQASVQSEVKKTHEAPRKAEHSCCAKPQPTAPEAQQEKSLQLPANAANTGASCCAHESDESKTQHGVRKHGSAEPEQLPKPNKHWLHFALVEMVDDLLPLVSFGLVLAAFAEIMLPLERLNPVFHGWDILILGLIGIPFYVCASASVPLAMVLLERGFSTGAVLVFLFAGPATNVSTILALNKVFGPRSGLKVAGLALFLAVLCGWSINFFYSAQVQAPPLHDHGSWSVVELISAVSLSLLGIFSLYRLGPLHWISTVVKLIPGVTHHGGGER